MLLLAAVSAQAAPYTVHEWGTFTTVSGADGRPLTWRPLSGPSDLPSFVHDMQNSGPGRFQPRTKGDMSAQIRMETPVLYFYTAEPMTLEASVSFPGGLISEWYPMARTWSGPTLNWGKVKLVPGSKAELPREGAPSHYYPAREVDAVTVESCGDLGVERDRFLFYRGLGTVPLPMNAKLDGANVTVSGARGTTLIFERRGSELGFVAVPAGDATVPRPALTAKVGDARAVLERALLDAGLYEKEAKAMLATWNDSWFEEGVRVFSLMGTADVERVLPLTLEPKPAALSRVLVARLELLTPERQAAFTKALASGADAALAKEGRFAEPLLQLAVASAKGAEKKKLLKLLTRYDGQAFDVSAF